MRQLLYHKLKGTFDVLTTREKQIVAAILNEKRGIEIAAELDIKHNTVSTFKKKIYLRLRVHSEIGLYKLAIKEGVIKL